MIRSRSEKTKAQVFDASFWTAETDAFRPWFEPLIPLPGTLRVTFCYGCLEDPSDEKAFGNGNGECKLKKKKEILMTKLWEKFLVEKEASEIGLKKKMKVVFAVFFYL